MKMLLNYGIKIDSQTTTSGIARFTLDTDLLFLFEGDSWETRYHQTCLHIAAEKGLLEVVQFLLKNNADPTITGAKFEYWSSYLEQIFGEKLLHK